MIYYLRTCVFCGKAIPLRRLEALPETRRCYDCSQKMGSDMENRPVKIGMDMETYRDLLGAVRS